MFDDAVDVGEVTGEEEDKDAVLGKNLLNGEVIPLVKCFDGSTGAGSLSSANACSCREGSVFEEKVDTSDGRELLVSLLLELMLLEPMLVTRLRESLRSFLIWWVEINGTERA